MNIEYRFKVMTEDGYGHGRYIVAKISGHRKKVCVKVTATVATGWRRQLWINEWDSLPKDDKEARAHFIGWAQKRVERAVRDLRDRRELLEKAEKNIASYPIVRIS